MTIPSASLLLLIFLCACAAMYCEGFMDTNKRIFVSIFFLTAAFAIRIVMLDHRSGDYNSFLMDWVEHFRQNGGFKALADTIGNYNLPYLYFLAIFSYIPIDDLYLIKYLSITFDVILAIGAGRIVLFYTDSDNKQLAAFLAVMLLPTTVLNGACWGQCDSIFAAFAVWAFYYAICKRSRTSLAFAALALSFKVQAVFFLPIYGVLLLTKNVRIRDIWVLPATYVATLLPAILLGHPILDAILLYARQVSGAGYSLNLNSASMYAFIPSGFTHEYLPYTDSIGIALAIALIYTTMLWTTARHKSVTDETLLGFVVLLTLGIPFFLPYMHERYFFMADIFTLVLAVCSIKYLPVAVLCLFGSLLGYYAYLKGVFFLPMGFGAAAMLLAFVLICVYIHKSFRLTEVEI